MSHCLRCWLLLGGALFLLQGAAAAQANPTPLGVVSVRVTRQPYDQILPWNRLAEESLLGNAVVVEGHRLITTADLVRDANLLEVRKFGRYPDYPARADLVDYELNLALLSVDDPAFWEGLQPLPIAKHPIPSGMFSINRWRGNGRFQQGSGEVVDFLVSNSPYGLLEFPVMRGTTAMGGLGWSEVLTARGQVIGLVISHENQQMQAITSDLIALLVKAAERNPHEGFAHRGFAWQRLNQANLRDYFGLKKTGTGVLVRRLFPGGTGAEELRPMDVLHKINGYEIDPEGRIEHPTYGMILFTMAINESLAPTIPVEIERKGKRMRLNLRRRRFSARDYRIPPPEFDRPNDYEVFGGLVLQELTLSYLRAWGKNWQDKAPVRLVIEYALNSLRERGEPPERVLFISRVLPDPANLGYQDVDNAIVIGVNGRHVASLEDFRKAVKSPSNGYQLIDILPGQERGRIVFAASQLKAINGRVRQRYGIPARNP